MLQCPGLTYHKREQQKEQRENTGLFNHNLGLMVLIPVEGWLYWSDKKFVYAYIFLSTFLLLTMHCNSVTRSRFIISCMSPYSDLFLHQSCSGSEIIYSFFYILQMFLFYSFIYFFPISCRENIYNNRVVCEQ